MEPQIEEVQKKMKRSKDPGVRVLHGRIYDSQNGKTCHQCRQKTMDFTAGCTNMKGDKQCTMNFCHKCLLNRYGENAEEMEALGNWNCPKCRDICNCSFCRKKKGHKPTGKLVHTAKATGFSSVSELLHVTGPDVCQELIVKSKTGSPKKRGKENLDSNSPPSSPNQDNAKNVKKEVTEELKVKVEVENGNGLCLPEKNTEEIALGRSPRKFNILQGCTEKDVDVARKSSRKFDVSQEVSKTDEKMSDMTSAEETKEEKSTEVQAERKVKPRKLKKEPIIDDIVVDVVLPPGNMLTSVAGTDFLPEDAGYALQFLEFCSAFEEVLAIGKGEPESVLRDIVCGREHRGNCSPAVQFLTLLLALILKDEDEEESVTLSPSNNKDSWILSLKRCLDESELELEDFPDHILDKGSDGYEMLEPSQKLRLLTFLCDESLSTKELRTWIEEQNTKLVEKKKEAKDHINAAREKEKQVKRKMQEEFVKSLYAKNGVPLTIAEHNSIISQLKSETERARKEISEAMGLMPKKRQRSDAVRTEPVFLDGNGHAFWRLKGFGDANILQDLGMLDQIDYKDKWFSFNNEDTEVVETYMSTVRLNLNKKIKNEGKTKMNCSSDSDIDSSSNDDSTSAT
ncbi:uncharacterized protein LOC130802317 [Amaranthus tricolor]|uniref:uncharacterized protein LOC130802317 n=1 Tax=Amaranthus tricolor TaxID=29722 RepID=UPI002587C5D3|nr:uncharacterized protein LOC130802317 [Amaranthus tricolor]